MFSFFSINSTDFSILLEIFVKVEKERFFFSSLIFESLLFKKLLFLLFFSVFSFSFSFRYLTRGLTQGESEVHETRHNGDLLSPSGRASPPCAFFSSALLVVGASSKRELESCSGKFPVS